MASLTVDGQRYRVEELEAKGSKKIVQVDGKQVQLEVVMELSRSPLELIVRADGRVFHVEVDRKDEGELFAVRLNGKPLRASLELFEGVHPAQVLARAQQGPAVVLAPMAGRIASLKVVPGTVVEEGQALFVLEAMKMENEVATPKKGLVTEVYVRQGAVVKAGDKLALVD